MDSIRFRDFAQSKGYTLPNNFKYSMGIGSLQRFKDTNKRGNNTNLWLKNVDDNIYVLGDWATQEKYNYFDNDNKIYTDQEKKEYGRKLYQQKQQDIQNIKDKQILSNDLQSYYLSLPLANNNHPYIIAKSINNHEVIKQDDDNKLVIPCIGTTKPFTGKLQTIQQIHSNGFKTLYKGANANGSYLVLNKSTNDSFIFVEGFATGMSVLQAVDNLKKIIVHNNQSIELNYDISVIVCFNCNNLKSVVDFFYGLYPLAEFNIWADNDISGVGEQKALEVKQGIPNLGINLPHLTEHHKQNGLSDWNDYLTKVNRGILA
jgi:phage/plasmid primase-like uncharacterized protein